MTSKGQALIPATRIQIRDLEGAKRQEKEYNVDFDLINPDTAFNKRDEYGDLEELGANILENGLIYPLLGNFVVNTKGITMFDLSDGFRRYSAIKLLKSKGKEVGQIPCRIKNMSIEERLLTMFNTQNYAKPLSAIEISNVFRELVNLGVKMETIQKKTSKSLTYISDMLVLSEQTDVVKTAVKNGQAAPTAIIKTSKKLGKDATKERVVDSINNNKKYTVKDSEKDIAPPQEKIKYERKYVLSTTLKGMEIQRDELLNLEQRDDEQRRFLNLLIETISKQSNGARQEEVNVVSTQNVPSKYLDEFGESKFDNIFKTKFIQIWCEKLGGIPNCLELYEWFKIELEGK